MEGFPSYQQHQTTSNVANENLVDIVGRAVVLENELMEDVGEGIVVAHRTGELLLGLRLHPNDVAVQVTIIFLSTTPVWKPLKDTLEECLGCTIRWPRARLKGRSRAPTVDVTHVASVFQFLEPECENACTPPMQPTVIGSKVRNIVEGRERVKFQFKIGGLAVCNKCYGVAVGYSER